MRRTATNVHAIDYKLAQIWTFGIKTKATFLISYILITEWRATCVVGKAARLLGTSTFDNDVALSVTVNVKISYKYGAAQALRITSNC